jgi:ADP-ribosyltransferase exoenzyme
MSSVELFTREEVLAGLSAKRARALLRAFGQSRSPCASIGQIERYAHEWAPLVPDNSRLRAAVARLLGQKYRFTQRSIPGIRRALGLDEPAVQRAYERQYGEPLEGIYAPQVRASERLRWLMVGVGKWLDRLPPFWFAFAFTFTETVGMSDTTWQSAKNHAARVLGNARRSSRALSRPAALRSGLNPIHVNLESTVGQWLKRVMRLPFKRHSQVDPMAAALQAGALFNANEQFDPEVLQELRNVVRRTGSLSDVEQRVLGDYQRNHWINRVLRQEVSEKPHLLHRIQESVPGIDLETYRKQLDAATRTGQLTRPTRTWRGVRGHHALDYLWSKGNLTGGEFQERGFVSLSVSRPVAEEFAFSPDPRDYSSTELPPNRYVLDVLLPEGSHVASDLVEGRQGELLLPRGSRFKVHLAEQREGYRYVRAELLVKQPKPFAPPAITSRGHFIRVSYEAETEGPGVLGLFELPDALWEIAPWVLRRGEVGLAEATGHLRQDETDVRAALDCLVCHGVLQRVGDVTEPR